MYLCVCKHCKKMFQWSVRTSYCKDCIEKEKEEFTEILDYLKEYPNSNAMQVAEALDLPIQQVIRYIDDGMLHIVRGEFSQLEE